MLKSLLLKDLRLLSIYLIIGSVLILTGFVSCLAMVYYTPPDTLPSPTLSYRIAMVLSGGSFAGLWFATIGCALLAGNAFTAERMDQSALFLDYLPPTRKQVLVCKLLVVVGFTALVFLISIVSAVASRSLVSGIVVPKGTFIELSTVYNVCKILTCVTGISFAVSAIAKSSGPPILLGLFSPLIVMSFVKLVDFLLDLPVRGETLFPRIANACVVVGVASMVMGCWWYVSQRYEN